LVNGADKSLVIKDLDRSYTTVADMHEEEKRLRSSLEAMEVALASAHRDRVAAQA
jgi:hypothetical protein